MKTIFTAKQAGRLAWFAALGAACQVMIAVASAQTTTANAPATNTTISVTNATITITNATVGITNGTITVTNATITISNNLIRIVTPPKTPPPPPVRPKWESSAAIGLTLTRGNSKTELFTGNLLTQKKTPQEEWLFGADAAYGRDHDIKNTETLHGFGQYNNLFDGRFYWGIRLDGMHDAIAAIHYRVTLAPLAGYFLIKQKNTTLAVEAGPALVYQKQGEVTRGYMSLRGAERFEHKFTPRTRLWETFEILPQVDNFNYYVINAEIGLEATVTARTSLRTYLQDTYYSIPAPGREKNDVKLVSAIAYKF